MRIGLDRLSLIAGPARRTACQAVRDPLPIVAACAAVACVSSWVFCFEQGINSTLWLDETWTGALASEPSLAGLTEQVRNEANAPLYYYVIWLWARVFGVSNLALHLPSFLLCIATPLIAWAGLHRSRPIVACVWAALLALWIHGIAQAANARCYPLLSLLAVVTVVLFIRAYDAPTRGRAAAWATGACLMTLTHYYAGPLALLQGIVLLARYRGRWREAWPAVLVFLPAFAWIGWHAPRIIAFTQPGIAWYDPFSLADLPTMFVFFLGSPVSEAALVAALAISLFLGFGADDLVGRRKLTDRAVLAPGLVALAATALCIAAATVRATFTYRYLTPCVPGVLLLVAAGTAAASRSRWQPLTVLIGGSILGTGLLVAAEDIAVNKAYGSETASAWIEETKPSRVAFFWDNPTSLFEIPDQLDLVGGFFFRRAGSAVDVATVYPVRGADMTGAVLNAARPDGAVLWLYDTSIHDTTAALHPPRLDGVDGLQCRDFGISNAHVFACRHGGQRAG